MRVLLLALLLAFPLASQDQPPPTCKLSGSVVDSATGAPLAKVNLQLQQADSTPTVATATVDSKGNFTMVNVPAGQYRLKATRNGFLDTYYGSRRAAGTGTAITLEPGQEMKDLQVKMFSFGVIAGVVRDTDGEPLVGASVKLYRQSFGQVGYRQFNSVSELTTDDLGQFRAVNLEPGKYFIRASRTADEDYLPSAALDHSGKELPPVLLPTFYPGTLDPTSARMVEVSAGARISGADITMVRSRVFRVKVHASATEGLGGLSVWLADPSGFDGLDTKIRGQRNNDKEDFEIRGVPPGSYTLGASANPISHQHSQQPGVFTFNFFERQFRARMPLTVSGDMEGVRITVNSGAEITGRVITEKSDKPPAAAPSPDGGTATFTISIDGAGASVGQSNPFEDGFVGFTSRTGRGDSRAPLGEDGTFATGLYPGAYDVFAAKSNHVIKSIRADGVDIYAEGLTITDGSKPTIEIVLAPEGGKVEGAALDKDDKPAAGATVLLVAEPKLRARSDSYHQTATDQNGRYHFDNIRPGEYKVFAWEDLPDQAWFDPDFLKDVESKGEPVTLAPNGHASAQVHVLPAR